MTPHMWIRQRARIPATLVIGGRRRGRFIQSQTSKLQENVRRCDACGALAKNRPIIIHFVQLNRKMILLKRVLRISSAALLPIALVSICLSLLSARTRAFRQPSPDTDCYKKCADDDVDERGKCVVKPPNRRPACQTNANRILKRCRLVCLEP